VLPLQNVTQTKTAYNKRNQLTTFKQFELRNTPETVCSKRIPTGKPKKTVYQKEKR